jgi:hypothetical protein
MPKWIALTVAVCAGACASSQPQPLRVGGAPPELNVPADAPRLIFTGQAEGAQIYACTPKPDGTGHEWKLKAPDAVVAGAGEKLRHYAGPTWEAPDGSKVVGEPKARADVDATSIPWLLLRAKSAEGAGPLAQTRWIQRLETRGGKAPAAGCDAEHAGAEVRVDYSAVYKFWGP